MRRSTLHAALSIGIAAGAIGAGSMFSAATVASAHDSAPTSAVPAARTSDPSGDETGSVPA